MPGCGAWEGLEACPASLHPLQPCEQERSYPWGDELEPAAGHRANIWQGHFPTKNSAEDGWTFTSPVDSFEPQNEHGGAETGRDELEMSSR